MVINGKDAGLTGNVVSVNRKQNTLIVGEKNLVWKHIPQSEDNKTGKVRMEMPIHYSNVMLVDPTTK
jgi:ribosomal protein L24